MFTNTEAIQLAESILWALSESSNRHRFNVPKELIESHLNPSNMKKLGIEKEITSLETTIKNFNNPNHWGCFLPLEEPTTDIESIKTELKEKKAKQFYLFELKDSNSSSGLKIILNRFMKKLIKTIEPQSNPRIINEYIKRLELQEATLKEIVKDNERLYKDYLNATNESATLQKKAERLGEEAMILNQTYLRLCEKPLSKDDCLALQNTLTAIKPSPLTFAAPLLREATSTVALDYTEFSEHEKTALIKECQVLVEKNPLLAEKCHLLFNYQKQALWKRAFTYPIITLQSNIPPEAYTRTIRHILNYYLDKSLLHKGYQEAISLYFEARISMIKTLQDQVARYPKTPGLMTQYLQNHANLKHLISATEGSISTLKQIIAQKITPGTTITAPVSTARLDQQRTFFTPNKKPETTDHLPCVKPSGSLTLSSE